MTSDLGALARDTSLPGFRTKIVCTLGPASASPETMMRMIDAGMNVARLNFSHGDLDGHRRMIDAVRGAAAAAGRHVAILADLPGPKIRLGELVRPVELVTGDTITLTTDDVVGDATRASVSFANLPQVVHVGGAIYVNDGSVQLEVEAIEGDDVRCRVITGGEIGSRKGVNLPGARPGIAAFTVHDRECLRFALEHGVDAISQSFVETRADVDAVRTAAAELGFADVFVIAKIERDNALANIGEILDAADAIMIARGDLGVETAIERIAMVQKQLARLGRERGKPVITATQMLESMTHSRRPTRAEATDVANAILDGTDCVMLSGESAIGRYPVEAVAMLARIARATEPHREAAVADAIDGPPGVDPLDELIARAVAMTVRRRTTAAVFVPTETGASARSMSRFSIPAWIVALTPHLPTARRLLFSYGVMPVRVPRLPVDTTSFVHAWLQAHPWVGDVAVIASSPSQGAPDDRHRFELVDLRANPPVRLAPPARTD